MKRPVLCSILGMVCLAVVSIAWAQQSTALPGPVCPAIEKYIAQIRTAGAEKEKAAREAQYNLALNLLSEVLKQFKRGDLLTQAAEFAQCTEQVAAADPTDAKFGDLLDKRLKSGAALQDLCMTYTLKR